MAKQQRAALLRGTTFQAICREGDFVGDVLTDEDEANRQANRHQHEPGCDEHIIDVVRIKKTLRRFKAE